MSAWAFGAVIVIVLALGLPAGDTAVSPSFTRSVLTGTSSTNPTVVQWGPDGRLYVSQADGLIKAYSVTRVAANDYRVTSTETIDLVQQIPNHNDDGSLNPSVNTRLVTGMLVRDPASNPVIYVTSSDPRVGGNGVHTGLDTSSGVVSRLTRTAQGWQRLDLVRGLPRSEHNHATNGLAFDQSTGTLYVAQGGHTNRGAPSNFFNQLPEYAYSAAILKVDLNAIGNTTYDLPTLLDDRLPGPTGPFGGDHGRHQAKIVPGSPVQVYASGLRNPYDLVRTSRRLMYTADNGSDKGLGATPAGEGSGGVCTNAVREYGVEQLDSLFLVRAGAYFGHPNPTRGNRANTFNDTVPQSPVAASNPVECDHRAPPENGALTTFAEASTGITEYKAANFGGEMAGDLLVSTFYGVVHRVKLTATGDGVVSSTPLFTGESYLTDVTSRASAQSFPGTIWLAAYLTNEIVVFEPGDGATG